MCSTPKAEKSTNEWCLFRMFRVDPTQYTSSLEGNY